MVNSLKQEEEIREEILIAINLYYDKYGFAPTIRELKSATGIKSLSTVHKHIEGLEKEGKITKVSNAPRTIRVV